MQTPQIQATSIAPGPRGHFLLGHLPERRKDPLNLFVRAMRDYGGVVRMKFGPKLIHLVNDPAGVKHVLQDNAKNYVKGFGYDQLVPLLGAGLLTSEGEFWRRQRKLAQPAFHRQRIATFATTMTNATEAMLKTWEPHYVSGTPFDVATEMMRLTMRIAGETLLSTDVSQDADTIGQALGRLIPEANRRILSLVHLWDKFPTPRNKRFKKALADLDRVVMGIIGERRKNKEDKGDLLSMLMSAQDEETGEGMTDKQLRDEVMTIFLAGHETTANALAWTWYLLSKHPIVERKLLEELATILNGRTATFEDVPRLRYTTMVIEETMRLYPPAWVTSRQALEDDRVCGFSIPKDSIVILSSYTAHRNAAHWPNPLGFDPERFADDKSAARPKYTYFPFSGGPRQCIGQNFAMMEAVLIVATIAQRYRLELLPGHDVIPEPLITLRPKNGIQVTLRRDA